MNRSSLYSSLLLALLAFGCDNTELTDTETAEDEINANVSEDEAAARPRRGAPPPPPPRGENPPPPGGDAPPPPPPGDDVPPGEEDPIDDEPPMDDPVDDDPIDDEPPADDPIDDDPIDDDPIDDEPPADDDPVGEVLDLPAQPFNYANPNYPAHYRQGPGGGALATDSAPPNNPVTDAGATLGRVLFYDTNLSRNRTTSCASCHVPEIGFSDNAVFSEGFDGGLTGRHSMGLTNARFNPGGRYFWDERAATLEDQVLGPIQDEVEMGMTLDEMEQRLRTLDYYPALFEAAFGDDDIDSERVSLALAQFVRSMVSFESRYDEGRAQVNNPGQPFPNFTAEENRGKQIYLGPAGNGGGGCAACHGVESFSAPRPTNNGLDIASEDDGIGGVTGNANQIAVFRTPSLRNIGVRPPYMHDGRFRNLQQVVAFYNNGVQPHRNLSPPLRAPGPGPVRAVRLGLSPADQAALVAFMHTLTDEAMIEDEKFSDPFID
ncbi:MAG: cytochrome-c peroxidase [Bradymonadia bacterium]